MAAPHLPPVFQDYLKVIWTSQEWSDDPISSRAIGARLGHSPSTVSETLKRLTAQGYLSHERYGAIHLTDAGRRAAVAMVRRHRLIETFLVDYLGYAWDEVHDEAEELEHAVSDVFVDRLSDRLGHPDRDPHGDPIPSASGTLPELVAVQLADVTASTWVTVARVSDADPDLLRYLDEHRITLDTRLQIVERHDYAGLITVQAHDRSFGLGLRAAEAIWVTVDAGS